MISSLSSRRVHIEELPEVPIKIMKAAAVHSSIVISWSGLSSACSYSSVVDLVYFFSTLCRNAMNGIDRHCRIDNSFVSESFKWFVVHDHIVDMTFIDDHTCSIFVTELRIESISEFAEELLWFRKILYGNIHIDLSCHSSPKKW